MERRDIDRSTDARQKKEYSLWNRTQPDIGPEIIFLQRLFLTPLKSNVVPIVKVVVTHLHLPVPVEVKTYYQPYPVSPYRYANESIGLFQTVVLGFNNANGSQPTAQPTSQPTNITADRLVGDYKVY